MNVITHLTDRHKSFERFENEIDNLEYLAQTIKNPNLKYLFFCEAWDAISFMDPSSFFTPMMN
jgi:hypothetical protein